MKAMGHVQSKWRLKGVTLTFAQNLLGSYFHEHQKNGIHLLYLYFVSSPVRKYRYSYSSHHGVDVSVHIAQNVKVFG